MGIFGSIFGSDTVIETAVKGIYNGVDNVVYTEQEKAEMRQRSWDRHERLLKLYEPFKRTQRVLAFLVGVPYVGAFLIAVGIFLLGSAEEAKLLASFINSVLGTPFSLIIGFYFAGGAIEGIVRSRQESK